MSLTEIKSRDRVKIMKTFIFKAVFIAGLVFMAGNIEANGCNFTRSLVWGSRGEDVRCLQQYLVNSGYSAYFYGYSSADGNFEINIYLIYNFYIIFLS